MLLCSFSFALHVWQKYRFTPSHPSKSKAVARSHGVNGKEHGSDFDCLGQDCLVRGTLRSQNGRTLEVFSLSYDTLIGLN